MTNRAAQRAIACASCVPMDDPKYNFWWESEGCIHGYIYGYCREDGCDGLCEETGRCDCVCHDSDSMRDLPDN